MEEIEIVRTTAELPDTSYFEFRPGPYQGQHWTADSVFVQEEIFCLIEPTIRQHHPGYDHYGHSGISASSWSKIVADLQALAEHARSARSLADLRQAGVGFHRRGIDAEFEQDFANNAHALAKLADDLCEWLRDALRSHDVVTVLGM